MATYSLSINAAGSAQNNDALRNINALFPFSGGTYRTISLLTRRGGIWCNCGGASQRVVLSVYDQLINAATGTVIKTSNTAECSCKGSGPAAENYATTSFTAWTQSESNAAIKAWEAGALQIRRSASIKSSTSAKHGQPSFRDGFYDDVIAIQGSTVPFTDYQPRIDVFKLMRSDDGIVDSGLSDTVYADVRVSMKNSVGLGDSPSLKLTCSTDPNFSTTERVVTLGATQAAIQPYFTQSRVKVGDGFNSGSNYYFRLSFTAGEEAAAPVERSVGMGYTPIHIPENNAGVALGMYSNAKPADQRFECNYPAYFYGGIAQIGGQDLLSALGIQAGQTAAQSVPSGNVKDFTITFPKPYAAAPVVIPALIGNLSGSSSGSLSALVKSVTATGCTIRVASATSTYSVAVAWVAVGKMA